MREESPCDLLEMNHIKKSFDGQEVLKDISYSCG